MVNTLVPSGAEGDVNHSPNRKVWQDQNLSSSSVDLLKRDSKAFLHQSVSTPCLMGVKKVAGLWIEDLEGKQYMDFHGNNVHHIGYSHPRLIKAITQQMQELSFAPRRYTCEVAVELAEKLAAISPGDLSKVLFATGGSDAIEIAMKIARINTGRFKTLSFWDSFHGAGFGASSIGGEQMFRSPIGPPLSGALHVPPFGDYRNAWGVEQGSGELCAKQIRYVLEKEGDVGAVIAEPNRAVPYIAPDGFWAQIRQACNDAGALLIFDEIPTGLGKTGRMFACDHDNVVPDILVLGKALGGGILPISAVVCRAELDQTEQFAIGHYTHEKNPVTSRAALTTLQIIEEEGLVDNAAAVGSQALKGLQELQNRYTLIGDVRGRGCLFGAELVTDQSTREPANKAADLILYKALSRGLSFKTTMGNVLTFTPPLITTASEIDRALSILDECFHEVSREFALA